ncbi:MAG: hypothetical protein AAF657_18100 [Acidobacteriota bacterium]
MSNNTGEKRILVRGLVNLLDLLGLILRDQAKEVTNVTKEQVETMLRNAITEFRETPNLHRLSKESVDTAIDRVYEQVYSDVAFFFDEEIEEASLQASAAFAAAAGSAFSFCPAAAFGFDLASVAFTAAAAGLEIDIERRESHVVAEANGLKAKVDEEPELAPLKKWNDAREAELETLQLLNEGMQSYRADSSLYSLVFVIDQKYPGLNDDELFTKLQVACLDANELANVYPGIGDKLFEVVSMEDPDEIKAEFQAMAEISSEVAALVGTIAGTIVVVGKFAYGSYKNLKSIKASWNAVEGEPFPEGMESRWMKSMTESEIRVAGVGAVIGVVLGGIALWQAFKDEEAKDKALTAIGKNRDSIKEFYASVLDHAH